jgi:hypothetical protein
MPATCPLLCLLLLLQMREDFAQELKKLQEAEAQQRHMKK